MKTWELLCIISSSLVAILFSGPWIVLSRSFKSFQPKLFLGIVSHMSQSIAPAMTVLMPISMFSMIAVLIGSYASNSLVFGLNTAALALNVLSLVAGAFFEVPAVDEIVSWASSSIPENWQHRRDRWIAIHKIRVFAGLASLLSLIAAMILEYHSR